MEKGLHDSANAENWITSIQHFLMCYIFCDGRILAKPVYFLHSGGWARKLPSSILGLQLNFLFETVQ